MTSFEEIEKLDVIGTPEECIEKIELYRDAGVETFMPWFVDFPSMNGIRLFEGSHARLQIGPATMKEFKERSLKRLRPFVVD
jgi:hypothetical protein